MRTEPYIQMSWSISGDLHQDDRSPVTMKVHISICTMYLATIFILSCLCNLFIPCLTDIFFSLIMPINFNIIHTCAPLPNANAY